MASPGAPAGDEPRRGRRADRLHGTGIARRGAAVATQVRRCLAGWLQDGSFWRLTLGELPAVAIANWRERQGSGMDWTGAGVQGEVPGANSSASDRATLASSARHAGSLLRCCWVEGWFDRPRRRESRPRPQGTGVCGRAATAVDGGAEPPCPSDKRCPCQTVSRRIPPRARDAPRPTGKTATSHRSPDSPRSLGRAGCRAGHARRRRFAVAW